MMFYQMVENDFRALGPTSLLKSLGNPLRLYLFEYLAHQELTVEELSAISGMDYKAVYKQLKILETSGLLESYLDGKYRYYLVTDSALQELLAWSEQYAEIIKTRKI